MPEIVPIFDVPAYDARIAAAGKIVRDGGIVVLPTETVYGAAGLINDSRANARLRSLRADSGAKPFTLHLSHRDDAGRYLGPVSDLGRRMMTKLWPGPVGLVFDVPADRQKQVADDLKVSVSDLYDGTSITLRCPDHIVATDVLGLVDGPVAMTRVQAGRWDELNGKADLVLDAGPSRYAKPSTIVRVMEDRYQIVREGVYDARIIERLLKTTILFVCSGNTCRSPMAEGLARQLISRKMGVTEEELERKGITVISAGSFAVPGARATPQAVEALRELGADLSKHRSRPLSVELIHQADRIFTMGRSHAIAVATLVPSALEKTSTLNPDGEIDDPIGGNLELYTSLAKQLNQLIEKQVVDEMVGKA